MFAFAQTFVCMYCGKEGRAGELCRPIPKIGFAMKPCDICGGYCGQCGDPLPPRRIPYTGDPLGPAKGIFNGLLIIFGFVVLMTLLLSGCSTFTGYTPPVLINGYDPTLTSHQEALGIREPRP